MNLKIYSAATTELVTVTEVKEHLRLDSSTLSSNLTTVQVVLGGYHDITASLTSSGTDVLGYNSMMQFQSFVSSAGSTVTAKIQESDDNTTYDDWVGGGFTSVTTANDTAVQQIEYTGTKQYIRPYVTISAAQSNFAVNAIKSTPYSTEDTYIGSLIMRARGYAERYQRRSLAVMTYDYFVNDFPSGDFIKLPMAAPMASITAVTSVTYMDSLGTTATLTASSSGYYVDINSEPALISLHYGILWPSFTPWPSNAIRIRYQAGYSVLPEQTKHAIIMLAGAYYTYRDVEIPVGLMDTIHNLLEDDRIGGWCD